MHDAYIIDIKVVVTRTSRTHFGACGKRDWCLYPVPLATLWLVTFLSLTGVFAFGLAFEKRRLFRHVFLSAAKGAPDSQLESELLEVEEELESSHI